MESGLISHIQKYSLQDGPGIRTTVFFKGCPLRCAWCHNPENILSKPQVVVFSPRCTRCGRCRSVCPRTSPGSNGPNSVFAPKAAAECLLCGACVSACPTGARVIIGRKMTAQEVLNELLADLIFYDDSQGGATFSGGEPLVQFSFLKALLESCKARGIRTALDTCGFAPREHLLALAPLTDLFLYDLKAFDEATHQSFTGVSNKLIISNLQALGRVHDKIWLRVPVIPTLNDSPKELDSLARLAASIPGIRQVNLLPYHRTGAHKFGRLGKEYSLPDLLPPTAQDMAAAAAHFTAAGLRVQTGG
jgi:pyruvate formate lyase activating enzyme